MKISLKPKTYWNIAQKTDMVELFPGKNKMIQGMKELLPIIEPYIKNPDFTNCLKNNTITKLFPDFLELVKESLRTPISGYEITYDKQYCIDIYCYHDINSQTAFLMPISFLPHLKTQNRKLYNIVIEAIGLLTTVKQVQCLDEECWGDMASDIIKERLEYNSDDYSEKEREEMETNILEFEEHTESYHKLLSNKEYSFTKLEKLLAKYVPKLSAEKILIKWTRKLIKAYNEPQNMNFFVNMAIKQYIEDNDMEIDEEGNCEFPNGHPITPNQVMKFVWYNDETIIEDTCQYFGELAGNFGEATFSMRYSCRTAKQLSTARKNFLKEIGYFPEYFAQAIEYGVINLDAIYAYSKGKLIETLK